MSPVSLDTTDLLLSAGLIVVDAAVSVALKLDLHRRLVWAAVRMVVQLVIVGYLLKLIFALQNPLATLLLVLVMTLIAAREILARPEQSFRLWDGLAISFPSVLLATLMTAGLALATAIRPHPWFDPRYAIPLAGIILGSVLNAGSLTLDSLLTALRRERTAIEAQLGLGVSFRRATAPALREAVRRGLLPIINQMSAAGLITLPGIMTGQIIAGMDPVDAVKYQILLMFLLAGASGVSALCIGLLALRRLTDGRERLRLDRLKPTGRRE